MKTHIISHSTVHDAKVGLAIPKAVNLQGQQGVSLGQFEQLKAMANRQNCSMADLVNTAFSETISNLLKTAAQ